MTVAELRAVLADLPDWAVVVVSVADGDDFVEDATLTSTDYHAGVLTFDTI
ncbi:hypothetical protein [Streptomyces sp. ITFR-6]|uniref:hypothetical protein n=1 Tax=Streptomyces sp. ITFR-6 TaxID=3075197 RepID=UPI00288C618D|nr:hypothetical protein [Streptomyces sp. ITFR-6]WNI34628.1 hypothetical protein RLT59_39065 [Streptomyces sp. ITFR-6]